MHADYLTLLYNCTLSFFCTIQHYLSLTRRVTSVTSALGRANLLTFGFLVPINHTNMSSSPLPIPSSDDDIEMAIDDELPQTPTPHGGQSMSQAPPPADPLFLAGTPSTQAGTPLRGLVARRAVGMDSTPRRDVANSPLFARKCCCILPSIWFIRRTDYFFFCRLFQLGRPVLPSFLRRRRLRKMCIGPLGVGARAGLVQIWTLSPLTFPRKSLSHLSITPTKGLTSILKHYFFFLSHDRSPARAATPRNRRGDIHSSLSLTPTRPRAAPHSRSNNANLSSEADRLSMPASSLAPLSAAPAQGTEDEPDEIRAIWGTTVNLADTMKAFREFVKGFKPKYRVAHDRSLGLPTKVAPSPAAVEVLLYEGYLRRMRVTGEVNLNLDCENLRAFPPSRKLYGQLVKYPQEVIPAMDQVLKDIMLELAEEDQAEGVEGMLGQEGEEEIADIMSKVYKVRPFGLPAVNMRSLNPQGKAHHPIWVRRRRN